MAKLTKARREYVNFLDRTLIPDLKDSGYEATAEDFEECSRLIRAGKTDDGFAGFLRHTLIPDLMQSGRIETARDFAKCARYIRRKS